MQLAPIRVRKKSAWTFNTSGTGGLGIEFVAVSGGTVVLNDPSGKVQRFHYGAAGGGVSYGVRKIPKIGRIDPEKLDPKGFSDHYSGNVAPEPFWNHGAVYIMDGCSRNELQRSDFHGICVVFDVGAGIIVGYSGSLMLVGVDPFAILAIAGNPLGMFLGPPLRPKAMILSRGWNVGPQASAGATGQVGYIWPS